MLQPVFCFIEVKLGKTLSDTPKLTENSLFNSANEAWSPTACPKISSAAPASVIAGT
jgi:hypothetical protein